MGVRCEHHVAPVVLYLVEVLDYFVFQGIKHGLLFLQANCENKPVVRVFLNALAYIVINYCYESGIVSYFDLSAAHHLLDLQHPRNYHCFAKFRQIFFAFDKVLKDF